MKAQEGRAAKDGTLLPWSSPSSNTILGLQSSGSLVQMPLGQSDASMAEHWPMQLVPWPQVTLVRVVSRAQQPTSIDSFRKVKAESKKSTSLLVVLPFEVIISKNSCE